jgi:tRNA modification GTPase
VKTFDRDIVEVRMDIGGVSCIVRDTAGLRQGTNDLIELEGIRRAK